SIPYVITDGNGGTATANALITVTPVNDAPVAVDDTYTVAEEGTVTLTPLTGDSDVDGDVLSITSINGTTLTPGIAQVIAVTNGTVNVTAAGVITFTPAANFNSTTPVSIPYVITDGNGGTATANALITVTVVTPVIVATNDDYSNQPIDSSKGTVLDILANDRLNNGTVSASQVVITIVDATGITGVTVDAQGRITIPVGIPVGDYILTYSICDVDNLNNCA
ncbi:Ig-like domain-containing protein, partial [Flavobacterium polysaccharolyticum]